MRRVAPILVILVLGACGRDGTGGQRADAAGETRSGLAGASGVARPDGAEARAYRAVPLRPMAEDVEILHGDPEAPGRPFVMRIRELAGTVIPPHTHPVDEHLTVVQGTLYFGVGERFDSSALRPLTPGSYAFIPAGTTMWGHAPELAVVQVHGVGPFHIRWRHGLDVQGEPGAATRFRFARGERVVGPRGGGTVRQGYASGALVQYIVDGADGTPYMAHEHELRRP